MPSELMSRSDTPADKAVDTQNDPTTAIQSGPGEKRQQQAAELIQRNYRGYRSRRQLQGMGLDPNARWAEV